MKPLLISTVDILGGASRAAYRLQRGLRRLGVESRMLVQTKASDDVDVVGPRDRFDRLAALLRSRLDVLPPRLHRPPNSLFHPALVPGPFAERVRELGPDLVHLHWIAGGMLTPAALPRLGRPIVWTLHDMWPLTGGCHYDDECGRYVQSCGRCPVIGSTRERDLSRLVWNRKRRAWSELEMRLIAPSRWLADCARKSSLFARCRTEVIPYGLDLDVFRPIDKKTARELIGLPTEGRLIMFGGATNDLRKGFSHLMEASARLAQVASTSTYRLVLLGSERTPSPLPLDSHCLGFLQDDVALALAYSAVDVFVAPSVQDNLPNAVMEALACGTPCVAFDVGGMPDLIEHEQNGYLARPFDTSDLANGITWTLSSAARWQDLSRRAREKTEAEFELTKIAARHLAVYKDVLSGARGVPPD